MRIDHDDKRARNHKPEHTLEFNFPRIRSLIQGIVAEAERLGIAIGAKTLAEVKAEILASRPRRRPVVLPEVV